MVKPLQKFDFRSSPYERPDKPWVCGYAAEGKPCQIGPDKKGGCRATAECEPAKSGDRWSCTRSQFFGGPCKTGPNADGSCCKPITPCQPVKSWRSKRGTVVRWAVGLTLGILLVMFALPNSLKFLSPGELSRAHASLTDCNTCHTSVNGGFPQWVSSLIGKYDHDMDSQQCQSCHDLGGNALAAHSLSAQELEELTAQASAGSTASLTINLSSSILDSTPDIGDIVNCSTCHKEHLGSKSDLAALDDEVCVVCHQNQFNSFNDGHPTFTNYPNNRRTHLNFDHITHIEKHFTEDENLENAPKACLDCHVTQIGGGKMVTQSFEKTCEICHGSQVEGTSRASAKGIPVFGLPGLDVETLADRGVAIGEWPEFAENELSPYMHLLLSNSPGFAETSAEISELDLLDLTDASDDQLSSVKNLVWTVKEFFYDLEARGSEAILERLAGLSGDTLEKRQKKGILAALPPDLLETARLQWFPSLFEEVQKFRSGVETPSPLSAESIASKLLEEEEAAKSKVNECNKLCGKKSTENTENKTEDSSDSEAATEDAAEGQTESEFSALFGEDEGESETATKDTLESQTESEFNALFGDDEGESETATKDTLESQTESEFNALFGDDEGESETATEDTVESQTESEFNALFGEDDGEGENATEDTLESQTESEFNALFGEDDGEGESATEDTLESQTESEFNALFGEDHETDAPEETKETDDQVMDSSSTSPDTATEETSQPDTQDIQQDVETDTHAETTSEQVEQPMEKEDETVVMPSAESAPEVEDTQQLEGSKTETDTDTMAADDEAGNDAVESMIEPLPETEPVDVDEGELVTDGTQQIMEPATDPEVMPEKKTEAVSDEIEESLEQPTGETGSETIFEPEPKTVPETEDESVTAKIDPVTEPELGSTDQPEVPAIEEDTTQVGAISDTETVVETIFDPIVLGLTAASVINSYGLGEEVFLTIKSDTDGFVNCYLAGQGVIMRIFPNRFTPDGYLANTGSIALPDSTGYSITADADGETIHCVLTEKSVYTILPSTLKFADFESLPVSSMEEVVDAYNQATGGRYGEASYTIRVN